jgi:hypothetical protein
MRTAAKAVAAARGVATRSTRVTGALICGALALLLMLAPGASALESTIDPGVGIGKIKLGMTEAQTKRAMGKWRSVNERDGAHLQVYWGFGQWTVDFLRGRVVEVATTVPAQRTPSRIGVGSTWRELVRAYPHGLCAVTDIEYRIGYSADAEYLVPHKGGTQTIYHAHYSNSPFGGTEPWHVTEIHVRRTWKPLPEFGSGNLGCKPNWRTSSGPV